MKTQKVKEKFITGKIIFAAIKIILTASLLSTCNDSKVKPDNIAVLALAFNDTTQSLVESDLSSAFQGDNSDIRKGNRCKNHKHRLPDRVHLR